MKRLFSLILIGAILLSLGACAPKAEATWQQQYDLGVRYLNEGKYEEAIIAFNAAIEIDPKQADAYISLAEVYSVQGDTEKAAEVLKKAVAEIGETDALSAAMTELGINSGAGDGGYTERVDNGDGSYYIYEYAPDGAILGYTYYDADGSFYERREYEYDENGTLIYEYSYDENGDLLFYVQYEYNGRGDLVRIITCDADGNVESIEEVNDNHMNAGGSGVAAEIVGGTLDIGNLQVTFVPGTDSEDPEYVGRLEYSFTVYGPENTHVVLIGIWTQGCFEKNNIQNDISMMTDTWRDMDISDWGYDSLPAYDRTSRPVDRFELNEVCETMFIGLDINGDATGYVVIRQLISPSEPANLPTFDEITYFGQPLEGFTVAQMEKIAAQNGWNTSNNQEWGGEDDYYWFQAEPQESWGVSVNALQYDNESRWSYLGYTHYYDFMEYAPISIGLRDIYTLDTLGTVLVKLGVPDAEAMAQEIDEIIANYTYDEAMNELYERMDRFSFYDMDKGVFFTVESGGGSGPADENGVYYLESMSVSLDFQQGAENYWMRFEFDHGFLTSVRISFYESHG